MVSRVSVKAIAISMVSAVIVVGVVPDSKASAGDKGHAYLKQQVKCFYISLNLRNYLDWQLHPGCHLHKAC